MEHRPSRLSKSLALLLMGTFTAYVAFAAPAAIYGLVAGEFRWLIPAAVCVVVVLAIIAAMFLVFVHEEAEAAAAHDGEFDQTIDAAYLKRIWDHETSELMRDLLEQGYIEEPDDDA